MFNFVKKSDDGALGRLEEQLLLLKKPVISAVEKKDMKLRLMEAVKKGEALETVPVGLQQLGFRITKIARSVKAPAWQVFSMRERILTKVSNGYDYGFEDGWFRKSNMLRTALSSVLLVAFVMTSFLILPFEAPTAFARFTYFDELDGSVLVLRDGAYLQAKVSFQLEEGDVILTRDESSASVHFLDDSVSRMAENTNVEIKRLYSEPMNPVATDVELYVKEGRVWNKVVNLTDDNATFKVQTSKVEATVTNKAAFDVSVNSDNTKITVFDNVVDVKKIDSVAVKAKTVVEGYQAEIGHSQGGDIKLESADTVVKKDKQEQKWVAENLSDDKAYDLKLAEQKEKILTANDNLQSTPVMAVAAVVAPDQQNSKKVEEMKGRFDVVYGKLLKAETMYVRGVLGEGNNLLAEFRKSITILVTDIDVLAETDSLSAKAVREVIREKISTQTKDLASFVPGDKLYRAKEAVRFAELAMVGTAVEGAQVKLSQAEARLLEFQQLLKKGKYESAMLVLRDYKQQMANFSLVITPENVGDFKDHLVEMVQSQIGQIKILTAVEQILIEQNQPGYRDEVELLRQKILSRLVGSLDKMPELLPQEVLVNLKDLFESYLVGKSEDAPFIAPVLEGLVENNGQVNFIDPTQGALPDQLGVMVIKESEGTPNARIK